MNHIHVVSLLLIEHGVFPVTDKRERLSADRERLLGSEICPHIVGILVIFFVINNVCIMIFVNVVLLMFLIEKFQDGE